MTLPTKSRAIVAALGVALTITIVVVMVPFSGRVEPAPLGGPVAILTPDPSEPPDPPSAPPEPITPEIRLLRKFDQLRRPFYSSRLVRHVIHQEFYKINDPKRWRDIGAWLLSTYGRPYDDGLHFELNGEIHDGRKDRAEPIQKALDPFSPYVFPYDFPISQADLARLIDELDPEIELADSRIEAQVGKIFDKLLNPPRPYDIYNPADRALLVDNDRLAVACMNRLIGKGRDADLRRYIDSRADLSPEYGAEMKEILARLK